MTGLVKVGGAWKDVSGMSVKVGGAWKDVAKGFTKVSGAWKEFFAPSAGSFDLLESYTSNGSVKTIEFTNLATTYGADYKHLQVRITSGMQSYNYGEMYMKINGTTNGYTSHWLYGSNTSIGQGRFENYYYTILTPGCSTYSAGATRGAIIIDIYDAFSTTHNKNIRAIGGRNYENDLRLLSSTFFNSAAINTLTFEHEVNWYFQGDTKIAIYGMRS